MPKIVCSGCGETLDIVVLSYGTRTWDEKAQSYLHHEGEDEGDWGCPKCMAVVSETRFYPLATGHPFPQTYGDWVDITEKIKHTNPLDTDLAHVTNFHLSVIGGMEPGMKPVDVDESKRWLVEKAGELGIK